MFARKFFFSACLVLFVTLALERSRTVHARYLPTRSNGDRVDKLRELLRDMLEKELDDEYQGYVISRMHPENKLSYNK
ncbi:hypothetical protein MTP99_007440 [Tenebrio molitor]|uniref:Proctolin 2 allele 2 n=1 Tax=Tenebrio molitor TaxID=7067 RepID=A0A977SQ68_TENMO|nr:hypothetical protein MTP99_007440 [Tenebrio molitor]UXO98104.1 proctolin 2 allele 2 [Tenebrio molitor]CAH1383463.1 unnamed protein product [Tenebrio molitor]